MRIEAITPNIGAEVHDVDLRTVVDDTRAMAALRSAFLEHHVLVFRDQDLDRDAHKAFGRCFGELHIHPSKRDLGVGGDPEIFTVKTTERTVRNNGGRWHMDVSCEAVPPLGSMLLLTEVPPAGGDTLFANMHLAWETLSPAVQRFLQPLTAHHDGRQDLRWYGIVPEAGKTYPEHHHPLVVAHSETGRPLLFVNEAFTAGIDELSDRESRAVLDMLFDHIRSDPTTQCRVRWEPGTMTFWDNRCTQHFAVWDYAPHPRRGERVSICGTEAPRRAELV